MLGNRTDTVPAGARRKVRVLHVGPLAPPFGGMTSYVERFLRSAVSEACDVRHVPSDLVGKYVTSGARRRVLNLANGLALCLVFLWALASVRPSIVHVQTSSFTGFYEKALLALIARIARRKVVMHPQGGGFGAFYEHSHRPLRWLIRRCLGINHRVVAISRQMRQVFLDIGVAPERLVVLENAVFVPATGIWETNGAPRTGDGPLAWNATVLFLNRIDTAKGVFDLIEAARQVCSHDPQVRFRIIGPESPDSRVARRMVADQGLVERIELPGPVAEEAKDDAFRSADVYVLPSHVEGMPIGLLEAMSHGLPCIATQVGGVPSVIEDGVNGLLVPAKDIEALTAAIERVTADPALRSRLGMAARATVAKRFNWDTRADQIIDLYNSLLVD